MNLQKADGSHSRFQGKASPGWPKILDTNTSTDTKKLSLRPETGRPWEIRDTSEGRQAIPRTLRWESGKEGG